MLNALNTPTWADLRTAFEDARDDAAVRGVILTGAGDKAFIAGADISELAHVSAVEAEQSSRFGQRVLDLIENLGKPVIAAVNGFALGGGCETAMACTIRIAVGKREVRPARGEAGLLPGGGGTQRLPRLVGKGRALQLILSGEMISAQEAYRIGLVNEVVPAAELITRAEAILKQIAANAPVAVRLSLEAVNKGMDTSQSEGLRSRPPTSASAPQPKTRRKARRPSSKSARPSSTGAERIRYSRQFRRRPMASDNIFSGLKVVDLASFIAGPSAAVILSDFGADVIKVEPPTGDTLENRRTRSRRSRKRKTPIPGTWPIATSAASRSI